MNLKEKWEQVILEKINNSNISTHEEKEESERILFYSVSNKVVDDYDDIFYDAMREIVSKAFYGPSRKLKLKIINHLDYSDLEMAISCIENIAGDIAKIVGIDKNVKIIELSLKEEELAVNLHGINQIEKRRFSPYLTFLKRQKVLVTGRSQNSVSLKVQYKELSKLNRVRRNTSVMVEA